MGPLKTPVALPTMLFPLGKACAWMDFTAVHDMLLKTGYEDEEGAENEVCQIFSLHCCYVTLLSVDTWTRKREMKEIAFSLPTQKHKLFFLTSFSFT